MNLSETGKQIWKGKKTLLNFLFCKTKIKIKIKTERIMISIRIESHDGFSMIGVLQTISVPYLDNTVFPRAWQWLQGFTYYAF